MLGKKVFVLINTAVIMAQFPLMMVCYQNRTPP